MNLVFSRESTPAVPPRPSPKTKYSACMPRSARCLRGPSATRHHHPGRRVSGRRRQQRRISRAVARLSARESTLSCLWNARGIPSLARPAHAFLPVLPKITNTKSGDRHAFSGNPSFLFGDDILENASQSPFFAHPSPSNQVINDSPMAVEHSPLCVQPGRVPAPPPPPAAPRGHQWDSVVLPAHWW